MKKPVGKIFSITQENTPVPGCTISSQEFRENGYTFSYFSMAAHTDISAESLYEACVSRGNEYDGFAGL